MGKGLVSLNPKFWKREKEALNTPIAKIEVNKREEETNRGNIHRWEMGAAVLVGVQCESAIRRKRALYGRK